MNRRKGDAVRLEIDADAPQEIVQRLMSYNGITIGQVYRVRGPVNLNRLMMLSSACPRPDLKYPPFVPNEILGLHFRNHASPAGHRRADWG